MQKQLNKTLYATNMKLFVCRQHRYNQYELSAKESSENVWLDD